MAAATRPEVVLCPFHAVGHVTPMMVLAKKLAGLGTSVRVLIPGHRLYDGLTKNGHDPTEGLDIVLEVLEIGDLEVVGAELSLRNTATGVRKLQLGQRKERLSMFFKHGKALRNKLRAMAFSESPPVCALVDLMLLPTNNFFAAKNHKLPIYLFSPAPTVSVVVHVAAFLKLAKIGDSGLVISDLPPFHPRDIPDYFYITLAGFGMFYMFYKMCKLMQNYDRIVINTFDELESTPLHALRCYFGKTFASNVYPVGPLLPASYFDNVNKDASAAIAKGTVFKSAEEEFYKQWLDAQLPRSVLYICFGSWISLNPQQIHELALGLEASEHKFLWVIPNSEQSAALPEGFRDRTQKQGLIAIGWAPQNLILSHPSTGAFLTTSGWNSVLECVSLAGIPMLAWPICMDQLPNCRYLVDGLKIAVDVIGDESAGGLVRREEVAKAVKKVMEGEEAAAMRERAMSLKAAACEAGRTGGALHAFVQDIVRINKETEEQRLLKPESIRDKVMEVLTSCIRSFF